MEDQPGDSPVYNLTKRKAVAADHSPKEQIQRSSISIISNFAEGYESQTNAIFLRYPGIAKASAGEVRAQLYIALDQRYISEAEFKDLAEMCRKTSRQLSCLVEYLRHSAVGPKT